jgi:sugar phosphate isomerase/epimerase
MPTVTFAVNTCFAVKRWPEPEEWARLLSELGVTHAQFSFDLADPVLVGDPTVYDQTRRVCDAAGVAIPSAFTGLIPYSQNLLGHPDEAARAHTVDWYRAAIDAAAGLGASAVGGHVGALTVRQHRDPDQRRDGIARIIRGVCDLSHYAAKRGLESLLWEIMPVKREYPADLEAAEELMDRLSGATAVPVELCLDMGHACAAGAAGADHDPYAWLERLGRHTRIVHVQQTDGIGDRHWPFTPEFNEQGIVDPERVVELVSRFDRTTVEIVLEAMWPFEADDDAVLSDLRSSVRYWEPALNGNAHKLTPNTKGG